MSQHTTIEVSGNLQEQQLINKQSDLAINSSEQQQVANEEQSNFTNNAKQISQSTNKIEQQNVNLPFKQERDTVLNQNSPLTNSGQSHQSNQQNAVRLRLLLQVRELQELQKNRLERQTQLKALNNQIAQQQLKRQFFLEQSNHINGVYAERYQQYMEIMGDETESIDDETQKIEENIYYLQSQIVKIRKECQQKLQQRIRNEKAIKIFQQKGEDLNILFNTEERALKELLGLNFLIERQIKTCREEYQNLQIEIHEVDMKQQNLKKYGIQVVSELMNKLLQRKQLIQNQIQQAKIQLENQRKMMQNMVPMERIAEMNRQILKWKRSKQQILSLLEDNQKLTHQNTKLNQIQWNADLFIQDVEESLRNQQAIINQAQRDISKIKKESNEVRCKINQFEQRIKGVKKVNKDDYDQKSNQQIGNNNSSRKSSRQRINKKDLGIRSRQTIYQQIKQQIQQQQHIKNFSWQSIFGRGRNQKKTDQPSDTEAKGNTYKINTRMGRFECCIITVIVCLLLLAISILYGS